MNGLGLVLHEGKFAYGHDHGFGVSLPMGLKRLIVRIWNPIGCRIYGHDLVQDTPHDPIECVYCLAKMPDDSEGVLRPWEE
jgi:hypothetical protein